MQLFACNQAKGSLRNNRKQALDQLKKMKGSVSDDDIFRYQKQVEDISSKFTTQVGDIVDAKVSELLAKQ